MTKFEIISLKLNGWSNCRIQREFSVSRNTIRKYWNDYQTKVAKLLEEDPCLDVRHDIDVYYKNELIASHKREKSKKETYIDIRHYLSTFLKKP